MTIDLTTFEFLISRRGTSKSWRAMYPSRNNTSIFCRW